MSRYSAPVEDPTQSTPPFTPSSTEANNEVSVTFYQPRSIANDGLVTNYHATSPLSNEVPYKQCSSSPSSATSMVTWSSRLASFLTVLDEHGNGVSPTLYWSCVFQLHILEPQLSPKEVNALQAFYVNCGYRQIRIAYQATGGRPRLVPGVNESALAEDWQLTSPPCMQSRVLAVMLYLLAVLLTPINWLFISCDHSYSTVVRQLWQSLAFDLLDIPVRLSWFKEVRTLPRVVCCLVSLAFFGVLCALPGLRWRMMHSGNVEYQQNIRIDAFFPLAVVLMILLVEAVQLAMGLDLPDKEEETRDQKVPPLSSARGIPHATQEVLTAVRNIQSRDDARMEIVQSILDIEKKANPSPTWIHRSLVTAGCVVVAIVAAVLPDVVMVVRGLSFIGSCDDDCNPGGPSLLTATYVLRIVFLFISFYFFVRLLYVNLNYFETRKCWAHSMKDSLERDLDSCKSSSVSNPIEEEKTHQQLMDEEGLTARLGCWLLIYQFLNLHDKREVNRVQISLVFFILLVVLTWLFSFLSMRQNWGNTDQPVIVVAAVFLLVVIGVASLYIIFPGISINSVPDDIVKSLRMKELELSIVDSDRGATANADDPRNRMERGSLIRAITLLRAAIRYIQYVVIPDPLTVLYVPVNMATFSGLVLSALTAIGTLIYQSVENDVIQHYDTSTSTGGSFQ